MTRGGVQLSALRAAPPAHFEQIPEVGLVTEDERQVDRAGVVVGELDALHQIFLDELPPSQMKPQLGIVQLARRIATRHGEIDLRDVLARDFARQLAELAPFDLQCRPWRGNGYRRGRVLLRH